MLVDRIVFVTFEYTSVAGWGWNDDAVHDPCQCDKSHKRVLEARVVRHWIACNASDMLDIEKKRET